MGVCKFLEIHLLSEVCTWYIYMEMRWWYCAIICMFCYMSREAAGKEDGGECIRTCMCVCECPVLICVYVFEHV